MTDYLNILQSNMDEASKRHLKQAAKWARIASIFGFVTLAGLLLIAISLLIRPSKHIVISVGDKLEYVSYYIFWAGTIFYPSFLLYRFSDNINQGINKDQKQHFTHAFKNLKHLLGFMAFMAIISVLILLLIVLVNGSDILSLK